MMLDKQNLISDAQDLSQVIGTYIGTDKIDLGVAGTMPPGFQARGNAPHYLGQGKEQEILVQIDETFTSGGAATLQVQLISDDDAAMGTPTVIQETPVLALAALTAGKQFSIAIPPGITERYLCLQYVIAGATTTAGTVTAGLLMDRQTTRTS